MPGPAQSVAGVPPADDLPEPIRRARWTVGDRIRRLRLDRGLSQEQLAGLMFLERRTVHRIERGTRTLTLDRAVQIAQALDVPLWRLFRDEDPPGG